MKESGGEPVEIEVLIPSEQGNVSDAFSYGIYKLFKVLIPSEQGNVSDAFSYGIYKLFKVLIPSEQGNVSDSSIVKTVINQITTDTLIGH